MNVTIKTQCPHCHKPLTVHERIPAELPAEPGDRVTLRGRLYVVTLASVPAAVSAPGKERTAAYELVQLGD